MTPPSQWGARPLDSVPRRQGLALLMQCLALSMCSINIGLKEVNFARLIGRFLPLSVLTKSMLAEPKMPGPMQRRTGQYFPNEPGAEETQSVPYGLPFTGLEQAGARRESRQGGQGLGPSPPNA